MAKVELIGKYDMSIGTVLINKLRFSSAHRRYD